MREIVIKGGTTERKIPQSGGETFGIQDEVGLFLLILGGMGGSKEGRSKTCRGEGEILKKKKNIHVY